jgi:hypothetical protein
MATRAYLSRRMAMLISNIDQMHKEIELINNLLREEHSVNAPQPLDGMKSNQSSVRRPALPTPLREMQPAFRDASVEMERNANQHTRQPSDSYFPAIGMELNHTVPHQAAAGTRKKPALTTARSEADLRGNAPQSPVHPAHRANVPGQSRFPHFSKLKPSLYKDV